MAAPRTTSSTSAALVLERATFILDDNPGSTEEWEPLRTPRSTRPRCRAWTNPRMLALTDFLRDGAEIYRQLGVERRASRSSPSETSHASTGS